jgi:hypothetical protein
MARSRGGPGVCARNRKNRDGGKASELLEGRPREKSLSGG